MIEIKRNNGSPVKVFAETFEQEAFDQVKALANYAPYSESTIRIMPDAHAGKGCTIGTTMTLHGKVTPNLVGVDIGCGMLVMELDLKTPPDLALLDEVIKSRVPSGFGIHDAPVINAEQLDTLRCGHAIDMGRAVRSVGTLGGGNHFIELDINEDTGRYYLVIHSGSRHLGVQVCKYYQDLAYKNLKYSAPKKSELVNRLKADGREKDIHTELQKLQVPSVNKELAHLEGKDFDDYIADMKTVQWYATLNRSTMAGTIIGAMGWSPARCFETIHNYIDTEAMILRKGAVRAAAGEELIIPMNMRDGSLICIGKGNPDWNFSAPHGAGRLMSRSKAKETLSMEDFKETMSRVYSTTVCRGTIDESPMAYKPMHEIMRLIEPTAEIVEVITPVYNFKAVE